MCSIFSYGNSPFLCRTSPHEAWLDGTKTTPLTAYFFLNACSSGYTSCLEYLWVLAIRKCSSVSWRPACGCPQYLWRGGAGGCSQRHGPGRVAGGRWAHRHFGLPLCCCLPCKQNKKHLSRILRLINPKRTATETQQAFSLQQRAVEPSCHTADTELIQISSLAY